MTQELPNIPPGLNEQEVKERRNKFGANKDNTRDLTFFSTIFKTIFSVFNVVMAILIVVLIAIDQKSTAQFIGVVAAINTAIELVQEVRARLIIKKLNKLSEKTTKVIRTGQKKELDVKELVIDDIIYLESGDRVPVDGQMVASAFTELDESILTGESKYIEKKIGQPILAGSFLASGTCYYKVTKLSKDSYLQTVTKQVSKMTVSESPLQSQINQIIKALTYMTLFFIALVVAEGIFQQNQKEEIIINSAVLISSLVPQGLVLITTISFAYGAMKMAKNQAIIQKLSAIEAMANTKVVCIDKTGTLTKNALEVKEISFLDKTP